MVCGSLLPRAVGSPVVMDPTSICRKARRLAGRQAELCQAEPEVVAELARGARLGVRECQFQFRFRRWNCSSHSKAFGRILQQGQCGEDPRRGLLSRRWRVRGEGGGGGRPTEPHFLHGSKDTAPITSPSPTPLCLAPTAAPQNPAQVLLSDRPSPLPQTSGRPPSCSL